MMQEFTRVWIVPTAAAQSRDPDWLAGSRPAHDAGFDFVAVVFRLRGRFRDFAAAPLRTAVVFCAHPVGASASPLLGRGVRWGCEL